jgi:hypothetical protein
VKAAQCGHATLACYKSAIKDHPTVKAPLAILADLSLFNDGKLEDKLKLLFKSGRKMSF